MLLDTDNNDATGSPTGNEYMLLGQDDPSTPNYWWGVAAWTPRGWGQLTDRSGIEFRQDGDVLSWAFARGMVGMNRFGVYAVAALWSGDTVVASDRAPDSSDWLYDISGPTRTTTTVVKPLIAEPVTIRARARARKRLTVSVRVTSTAQRSKPLTRASLSASPSVAGRVVGHSQSFKGGVARISFVVPRTAKGKSVKLVVKINARSWSDQGMWTDAASGQSGVLRISYLGKSSTKVMSFPVR